MNTTVKTVVALIGWLRRIWMPSFVVEIPEGDIFWIDEKVDADREISNDIPEFVKNC
jgi:hypothetical protein